MVPVKSGTFKVRYIFTAGLGGKATARLAGGGPAAGRFLVHIAGTPPAMHVDPTTGKLVPGAYPTSP